jgi:hypothetical protein
VGRTRGEGSPFKPSISFGRGGEWRSASISKRMSLAKVPSLKEIGSKLTASSSDHLGDKINKSRFSYPANKHLAAILLALFASLAVVNVLTYLVVKLPCSSTNLKMTLLPLRIQAWCPLEMSTNTN